MKKYFSTSNSYLLLFILLFIVLSIILALSVGIFDTGDSFAYAALGEYLLHGMLLPMIPFNLDHPQTLFPPVYALFITPLLSLPLPWGSIGLPLTQFFLVLGSTAILFFIMKRLFSPRWAAVGALIFILLPFNIIHPTLIMSETLTEFLVSVYVLALVLGADGLLFFLSCILVLTRYAFLPCLGMTLIMYVKKFRSIPKHHHLLGILGILLIAGWILFNHSVNGSWTLSSASGRHLYNNVVATGHLDPPRSNPKTAFFYAHIPRDIWQNPTYPPWWEIQKYFSFEGLSEIELDHMFLQIATTTVLSHPVEYLAHLIRVAVVTPLTAPRFTRDNTSYLTRCDRSTCLISWNSNLCTPIAMSCRVNRLFAMFISLNQAFFPIGAAVFYIVVLIGIIYSVIKGTFFWKWIAILFLFQHIFQSTTEWIEGRFLLPLYPLSILLFLFGIQQISRILRLCIKKHIASH